ncbi:hypothetical protein [Actinacidiphila soli]|uniref:hypothetical protein n=1 Tax=Actinacidiphila soli TaxID=2487275 RepID=UPI000FCCB302|nr:hypothetical protein [Actinacidiphila soli]
MIHADPYMVRDHWLHQGRHGYAEETHEGYGRDLGRVDERGHSIDLAKLADYKAARAAAQAAGEPFDQRPPPLGWIPFIAELVWEATPWHVDAWLNQWQGAVRSRSRRRSAVFGFYEHAVGEGIVPGNPARPIRNGVTADLPGRVKLTRRQAGMLRSAADRYAAPRDRLLVYLLLADLRPGQVVGVYMESIYREQQRVTSKVPLKGGGSEKWEWPAECVEALDGYLPGRMWRQPHSSAGTGPLLTSRNGRKVDAESTPRRIVREVAAAHPGLVELAPHITADGVALSLSPFADEDQD